MTTALICGVLGQDGAYLAEFLLSRNYTVCGTSRDAAIGDRRRLRSLGIDDEVELHSMNLTDFGSILKVLDRVQPDEIYNLAGQTSVGLSFEQPREALESIASGTLDLLEAIRFLGLRTKLYNAGSSECFGDTGNMPACEKTAFRPRSPYATAKAAAFWHVVNYREAYGLYVCSGILFNHESPLRPDRFVTRKISSAVHAIRQGHQHRLELGDLAVRRDWGWAPEYVRAMWMMLQQPEPDDFVIATGETNSLEDFVAHAFAAADLDWRAHVVADPALIRAADIRDSRADPGKAFDKLGWAAEMHMPAIAKAMVAAEGSARA